MAHKKAPQAQRRRRKQSNPVFCTYIRKANIKGWTNRLKMLYIRRNSNKAVLRFGSSVLRGHGKKLKGGSMFRANKKGVQKQTNAAVYSSPYCITAYPVFSKAVYRDLKKPRRGVKRFKKKLFFINSKEGIQVLPIL